MQLNVNDEQLNQIITSAVLSMISGEERDNVLSSAIQNLLEKDTKRGGFGETKTRLERAFEMAVSQSATLAARDLLETEPYKSKLRGLLTAALDRVFDERREKVIEEIGETLAAALCKGLGREY